jgi:hypothetical protein
VVFNEYHLIQTAGTAIDIPLLHTVIQTVNVSSLQANEQNHGRLRDLPGKDVMFLYLYSKDIQKHKQYHLKRMNIFRPISKKFYTGHYPRTIGGYKQNNSGLMSIMIN